jgi:lysophospholipase L1-like esterase
MNQSAGNRSGSICSMKRSFRFPAFLSILVFLFASCGGGGGDTTSPLAVQTDNATSVTQNEAVLNGTVNPNGTAAEAWFEYGINPNLASFDNTITQDIVAETETRQVSQPLAGLTPGTTYYFQLVGSSESGLVEGEISSFTTHNPPPAVSTEDATSITLNGATLNGSVNPNGAATIAWFEYGPDPDLVSFIATDNQNMGSGRDSVPVDNTLSGLDTSATFYYRLVAASVEGEVEGAIKSFSTAFPPPAATTGSATNITTTGATFQGTVNPNGFSTDAWFEYGLDNSLATFEVTTPQFQGSGTSDNAVSAGVGPLIPFRTYYFRTVAGSTTDPDMVTKGEIRSFPTGEYYVALGDSITVGSHDTIPGDGIGYEPVLDTLLTDANGYPHTVVNAGASGETSADGVNRVAAVLSANPSANYLLILYGTNDAIVPAVPSGRGLNPGNPGYNGSYKDNMQRIITAIRNTGMIPYLAKVPFTTDVPFRSDSAIRDYNAAIDELRISNGISVVAPDFYAWFQSHQGEMDDGLHPNGTGYQSMAARWFEVLP